MRRPLATPRDRARSAAIAGAVHVVLGYALLTGLGVTPVPVLPEAPPALIDLAPPPPDPPAVPMTPETAPTPTERPKDPEGAAAPPALRNTPTPVVAPPPVVRLPVPPPLPAAPIAGTGSAAVAGAAPTPGPGTGRGGEGEGLGSGRFGDGTGGGGGGGVASGPRYVSGEIREGDGPPGLDLSRPTRVGFRLLIDAGGRARECRVTRSSGISALDAATCRAALRRLRWAPARNTAGRPIEAWAMGQNEWLPRAGADRWVEAEEVRD